MESRLHALSVYRAWAGMNQDELAEASGVSRRTISALENGRPARPSTTKKVANALGVQPKALMDFETLRAAGN